MNAQACLFNAARRLRYLRSHPVSRAYPVETDATRKAMAFAYEMALRIVIDEFGARDEFHSLFYGSQLETTEAQPFQTL